MTEYFDFIFATGRFNLSEQKEHFINECCFGEDVAAWLQQELDGEKVKASEPGQEDWGWYITAFHMGLNYFIAINGDPDGDPTQPNQGEWRISIHKPRSLMDKILGRKHLTNDDFILHIIKRILKRQPDIMITETESSRT